MHDVGVVLDHVLLGDLDGADSCHPADVVSPQIEQHQVFRQLFRVRQQIRGQRAVFLGVGAAPSGPGDGADGDDAVAQPDQDFRARSHHLEGAEIEVEQERRRVEPPERPVQREGRQGEGRREALRGHDLEDVAGVDILLRRLDHGVIGLARRVRLDDRRRDLAGRGFVTVGQRPVERFDRLPEPRASRVIGGLGVDAGGGPHRGNDGDRVLYVVEDGDHRRAQE